MKCTACEIKDIEAAAKLIGERTIETLDGDTVNVFVVPDNIGLQHTTGKQDDKAFRDKYLSTVYMVGKKVHTCSLANQVSL